MQVSHLLRRSPADAQALFGGAGYVPDIGEALRCVRALLGRASSVATHLCTCSCRCPKHTHWPCCLLRAGVPLPCFLAASLQAWLEVAWQAGFDPGGAAMFDAAVQGSRKWIGTTEAAALLRYFGCRALIVDFHGACAGWCVLWEFSLWLQRGWWLFQHHEWVRGRRQCLCAPSAHLAPAAATARYRLAGCPVRP
jgi:hypothetical protein